MFFLRLFTPHRHKTMNFEQTAVQMETTSKTDSKCLLSVTYSKLLKVKKGVAAITLFLSLSSTGEPYEELTEGAQVLKRTSM